MIQHPAFRVDPWCLHERELHLDILAQTESLFALSNGHVGLRGNLDEGEPHGLPGTYLNGFYELRRQQYTEVGYGYPQSGQTLVDAINGKLLRLLVDDEPFDVRYGELRAHERVLDFRAGTLRRCAEWTSPARRTVRVTSTRVVSFTQRAIVAILYEVEPLDGPANIVVQSELVANEQLPCDDRDPRAARALAAPLVGEDRAAAGGRALLVHRTKRSGLRIAACMDHFVKGSSRAHVAAEACDDWARVSVTDTLNPGERLTLVKMVAYGWSGKRTIPAMRDQVAAALEAARISGWEQLLADQRAYLDAFWDRADVEVEGDAELQQAVRFGLFHVLQAAARAEGRAIPAKGLTGSGYDGHSFWDTETFVVPVLTRTIPDAAADALRWRHSTLGIAKDQARALHLQGAAFPWRTIDGEECSGYWPAGTAAFHVNADVADAVLRYVAATGDDGFERDVGVELLVETARLWRSLGHHDESGAFHIDGVTGPDEYSAVADDNVFTNLMARRNLVGAADACTRHPGRARALGVTTEEMASWRTAAEHLVIPYNEHLRVHEQDSGFTSHEVWDFSATRPDEYPLMLHFPYYDLYRKQVVKQPDLVLAMQLCGDAFTADQKARNFAYYERVTVRDSSLAACTEAVVAAEVGHLQLALDYVGESALIDLADLEQNARDGLHVAALAGTWMALVAGFGGMRDHAGALSFGPRLPDGLTALRFTILHRGCRLRVSIKPGEAVYRLLDGKSAVELVHHGEPFTLRAGKPVRRAIPRGAAPERVEQPAGREPRRRAPESFGPLQAVSSTPAEGVR